MNRIIIKIGFKLRTSSNRELVLCILLILIELVVDTIEHQKQEVEHSWVWFSVGMNLLTEKSKRFLL